MNFHMLTRDMSVILLLLSCGTICAQSPVDDFRQQIRAEFDQFKQEKNTEFEAFRTRVNKEFAEFMREKWQEFGTEPPIPVPDSPEPPKPVVAPKEDNPSDDDLKISEVKPLPKPLPAPSPLIPKEELPTITPQPDPEKEEKPPKPAPVPKPVEPGIEFSYYGRKCKIPYDGKLLITLGGINEDEVANAWEKLSDPASVETVKACVGFREDLRLPDWGYVTFLEQFASAVFPAKTNEARLLMMFLLTQSGYKVRIGRNGSELVVLLPCKDSMYSRRFIRMDGLNYYLLNQNTDYSSTYVFDRQFPKEQLFTLAMKGLPEFPADDIAKGPFTSTYGPGINVSLTLNRNLIDFLNDYPLNSNWNLYANASLSAGVKDRLYPPLRKAIEGKSVTESANVLLRFVQKAFDYRTDDEQFGVERALFGDETFFYPYSDCEDRAILYSTLVRDLLGLDVVLVFYPGHLATAVRFEEDVTGDHFVIDGKKYIVCDPTYINSNVGMAMPQYKTASAEIIKL